MPGAIVIRSNYKQPTLPVSIPKRFINDKMEVDIPALEAVMDNYTGKSLSKVAPWEKGELIEESRSHVHHYNNNYLDEKNITDIKQRIFDKSPLPNAMYYENEARVMSDIFRMYQVMYFHYILGKTNCMKGCFPSYCCGISSQNITVSLWEIGVVAAAKVFCRTHDHAYVIVPFVIKGSNQKRVILMDPTSDQLMFEEDKRIRNDIRIVPAPKWEYRGAWANGNNLYPEVVEISASTARRGTPVKTYLEKAFANPVTVSLQE